LEKRRRQFEIELVPARMPCLEAVALGN